MVVLPNKAPLYISKDISESVTNNVNNISSTRVYGDIIYILLLNDRLLSINNAKGANFEEIIWSRIEDR